MNGKPKVEYVLVSIESVPSEPEVLTKPFPVRFESLVAKRFATVTAVVEAYGKVEALTVEVAKNRLAPIFGDSRPPEYVVVPVFVKRFAPEKVFESGNKI